MMAVLLEKLGAKPKVICSNPNVWTSVRRAGNRILLFAVNTAESPQEAEIVYRPGIGQTDILRSNQNGAFGGKNP